MLLLTQIVSQLWRIPDPIVGRKEALGIAENAARVHGLRWTTPNVVEGLSTWVVQNAADPKPSPWIVIDNYTT